MGRLDVASKVLMRRGQEFADVFNLFFKRAGIEVDPASLVERSPEMNALVSGGARGRHWWTRSNDLVFEGVVKRQGATDCVLFCLENQSRVSYEMPLRNLVSSGMRWETCRYSLEEQHIANGDYSKDDMVRGLLSGDRLSPVVVLVLYLGCEPWNGPARMQDMVDCRILELRQFMADCPANVVSLVDLTDSEVATMKSSLRVLAKLLRAHGDGKKMVRQALADPLFRTVPSVVYEAFNELTGAKLPIPRQKEGNDMCLALQQIEEMGMAKGMAKGKKEGLAKGKKEGLAQGLAKGKKEGLAKGKKEGLAQGLAKGMVDERDRSIMAWVDSCRNYGMADTDIKNMVMANYSMTSRRAAKYLVKQGAQ